MNTIEVIKALKAPKVMEATKAIKITKANEVIEAIEVIKVIEVIKFIKVSKAKVEKLPERAVKNVCMSALIIDVKSKYLLLLMRYVK